MNKVKPWRADLNNFNISKMWKYKNYICFYLYHKKTNRAMLCSIDEDTDVFDTNDFYIKVKDTSITRLTLIYRLDEDFTSFDTKENFHKQICQEIKKQDIRNKYKRKYKCSPEFLYPKKFCEDSNYTTEEYLDCYISW